MLGIISEPVRGFVARRLPAQSPVSQQRIGPATTVQEDLLELSPGRWILVEIAPAVIPHDINPGPGKVKTVCIPSQVIVKKLEVQCLVVHDRVT